LIPSVVEPSVGCDRLFYAVVASHYKKETINDDVRELLALPYDLVPYKIAVLPLVNKLNEEAKALYLKILELGISATFDTSGTIGRRYRRQDAIGTYYCITVDFDSLKHKTITIRNRDTTIQDKIKIRDLIKYLNDNHSVF
jgi:glycyl-tRNA synthetase